MKKIFTKFSLKSDFAKNAFTLSIGTSIAQAFPMLFYPVLGRIFTPEQFGLLATLTSLTAIIGVLATGYYEKSILITETKQDAANVVGLVLLLSITYLLFSYTILQLFSNKISLWFNAPSLGQWLFVIPLNLFVIIIFNIYNEWCVRNKYFVSLSWNKIINAGSTTLGKLFFGFVKVSSNGLIIGDLVGRTISAIGCVYRALRQDKEVFFQMSFKKMKELAIRYIEFPKFYLPGQVLNTFGGQLPVMLIGVFFNSIEVGYFAMTTNILSVPTSVISTAIRDTFRQRANEDYKKNKDCSSIFKKTFKLLSLISVFGLFVLFFLLPVLFQVVLGKQWIAAGEYAQILVPMIALSFISNALSGVLIIAEKMKVVLLFQAYYLFITFISLGIGYWLFKSIKMTLLIFAMGRSSAYLLEIYLSYKYSINKKN